MIKKISQSNNKARSPMFRKSELRRGFTLVEIIVSLGVFSVVILIVLGAVLGIINLQRKTNAFRVAQENLSYAFESMVKEIRTGHRYNNLVNGENLTEFSFLNDQEDNVYYEVYDGRVVKGFIVDNVKQMPLPLTSDEVTVESLTFTVVGAGGPGTSGEGQQPIIRAMISGVVGAGTKYETKFFLQTAITQRKPDS